MFEDSKKNQPEDIFAEVEGDVSASSSESEDSARSVKSVKSAGSVTPPLARSVKSETGTEQILESLEEPTEDLTDFNQPPARSRLMTIIITVVVTVIIIGVAWGVWSYWQGRQTSYVTPKTNNPASSVNKLPEALETEEPINQETEEQEEVLVDVEKDTDGDGLTDKEEEEIGTDLNKPDTDADGLSDRDEVEIYQTNPINPDTDKDEALDGAEVRRGDDPNGPGRLLELPVIE